MRLPKASQIKSIIQSFDPNVEVYLFGSRTDDHAKGGDIDLLLLSPKIGFRDKVKILVKIYDLIGEQKVDLVLGIDSKDPFHQLAIARGIKL